MAARDVSHAFDLALVPIAIARLVHPAHATLDRSGAGYSAGPELNTGLEPHCAP
jgi:hypothetical protein